MEPNLKVTVVQEKISDNQLDSLFYQGDIAYVNLVSGNKLYAEATGEIRITLDDDLYVNDKATEEIKRRNLTDHDLFDLSIEDVIGNNNWFVIIKVDGDGNVVSDDIEIADHYNQAIEMLLECAKKEHKKEYK